MKRIVVLGHVPLAAVAGRVAVTFQGLREREFVRRHPRGIPGRHVGPATQMMRPRGLAATDMGHLRAGRMRPAHDRAPARATGRRGRIGLPELHALLRHFIEMRRVDQRFPVAGEVGRHVVDNHPEDVWPRLCGNTWRRGNESDGKGEDAGDG